MKTVRFQYPPKESKDKEVGIIVDGTCVFLTPKELVEVMDAVYNREKEIVFNDDWIGDVTIQPPMNFNSLSKPLQDSIISIERSICNHSYKKTGFTKIFGGTMKEIKKCSLCGKEILSEISIEKKNDYRK